MPETLEAKRPDDLVILANKTDVKLEDNYNGCVYILLPKEEKVLRRDIAEHLWKRMVNTFQDAVTNKIQRNYLSEVVELPVSERQKSPGEFPNLVRENDAQRSEIERLKEENARLLAAQQNGSGSTDNETNEPEKRKPGRPRGS